LEEYELSSLAYDNCDEINHGRGFLSLPVELASHPFMQLII
jgi:hypothetical protein